jgi:stress response protein YsnF
LERNGEDRPVAGDATPYVRLDEEVRVAAVREELAVSVKPVETGAVRVRTVVHEDMHPVSVSLRSEKVNVERIPVGRAVDGRTPPRQEGDTLVIPVYEYVPVVRMQLTLKEEVRVTTVETVEETSRNILLHTEEVVVERRAGKEAEWERDDDVPTDLREQPLRK